MEKTFERCDAQAPRPYGVYTCDLPQGHTGDHIHVCQEQTSPRTPYTRWHVRSGGLSTCPIRPRRYLKLYGQALVQCEARMGG